jgi:hypothetical protein
LRENDMLSKSRIYRAVVRGFADARYLVMTVAAIAALAAITLTITPAANPPPPDYATASAFP